MPRKGLRAFAHPVRAELHEKTAELIAIHRTESAVFALCLPRP
jgi:hypothetical protein